MKISVFGNRSITDVNKVVDIFWKYVETLELKDKPEGITYVWGGADGPSNIIAEELREKTDIVLFKPWHLIDFSIKFGPKYFYFRNKQVVENSDAVLILTTGEKDAEVYKTVELCEQKNKEYTVINM